jgi:hypothetical protein
MECRMERGFKEGLPVGQNSRGQLAVDWQTQTHLLLSPDDRR